MKRIFVCSPYRGDVAANVEIARAACREVLRAGDAPLVPHLLYPDVLDDDVPAERSLGIEAGRCWLAMANEVLVVGPITAGMREEIATAEALGIPVRYAAQPAKPSVQERGGIVAWLRGVLPAAWDDRAALAAIALVVLGFLFCPGR
ncbi:MAG: DUF4406 domain-containing protein [Planctomycetes bacterium]|nr:DUF4406 domain-containing protein [Planctomycetota bacterium]